VAGTRSGASMVVGVLNGAHTRSELAAAPHTHLIGSVTELPALLVPDPGTTRGGALRAGGPKPVES
jgi:hypothetical protein